MVRETVPHSGSSEQHRNSLQNSQRVAGKHLWSSILLVTIKNSETSSSKQSVEIIAHLQVGSPVEANHRTRRTQQSHILLQSQLPRWKFQFGRIEVTSSLGMAQWNAGWTNGGEEVFVHKSTCQVPEVSCTQFFYFIQSHACALV